MIYCQNVFLDLVSNETIAIQQVSFYKQAQLVKHASDFMPLIIKF